MPDTDTDTDPHTDTHPDPDAHPQAATAEAAAHADPHAEAAAAEAHPAAAPGTDAPTGTPAAATAGPPAHPAPTARTGASSPARPRSGPEAHSEAHSAPLRDPGDLSGVPRLAASAADPARSLAGHLCPAHHRPRGGRRRRAASTLILEDPLPEWLVLTLAMVAACVVVVAITFVRHRAASEDEDPTETPDVIEYMTMWIGVIYAIVLGLAIAGVWEARGAAQDHVRAEAQALHEISERVRVYPPEVRDRIRDDVNAYVGHVVTTEWKAMADRGEVTERGDELLRRIRVDLTDYEPRDDFEAQAYQPLIDQISAADQARNARADSTEPTMPGVVWFGLITGAVITIGMILALQIRRTPRELILAVLFSALIAFMLFLIWDFDAPYSRGLAATADPFLDLFPGAGR